MNYFECYTCFCIGNFINQNVYSLLFFAVSGSNQRAIYNW